MLGKTTAALDRASIPYAIVGGYAVAAWVATKDPDATRYTKDVDVLINKLDFQQSVSIFRSIDLMEIDVLGVPMFMERNTRPCQRSVRVLFANERLRPSHQYSLPTVESSITSYFGWPVVQLTDLLVMKLQAFRTIDRVHIRDMLSVNLITDDIRRALPADMLARLQQIEATPEDTN